MLNRDEQLREFFARKWPLLRVHYPKEIHGDVVVCSCAKGVECPPSNKGKHPASSHGVNSATPLVSVAAWGPYNVGLACGHEHVVVDIDPRNGGRETLQALEAKHGPLPRTWLVSTGGGGHHHVYSVPTPQRSGNRYKAQGVELKGLGSYVIAVGSLHQSGRRYEWEISPDDCALAECPQWVIDELCCATEEKAHPEQSTRSVELEAYTEEDVRSALDAISPDCDYWTWVEVGMSLHSAGLPFSFWDEWSAKGKDYPGSKELEKKWHSFRPGSVGIGSLIYRAQEAGWTVPVGECPIILEKEKAPPAEISEAVETTGRTEPTALRLSAQADLLSMPPGIIGEIAEEIYNVANFKDKRFAIAAAISTISIIAQGNYHTPIKRGYLSSYFGFIASPSWGKEAYTSMPFKVISKVAPWLKCGEPQSPQAMRRKLYECNSQAVIQDEILLWLKKLVDNDDSLQSDLLTLWGSSMNFLDSKETKHKSESSPAIECPRLSIIGGGTLDTFYNMLSKKGAELSKNGLMSRFDFILVTRDETPGREDNDFFPRGHWFQTLFAIAGNPKNFTEVDTESKVTIKRSTYEAKTKVEWSTMAVREYWYDLRDRWRAHVNGNPLTSSLWNRAAEKVLRTACLIAITEDPKSPVVNLSHLQWALHWQETLTHDLEGAVLERTGRSDEVELKDAILDLFTKKITHMTLRDIRRNCWPARGAEHAKLMRALEALVAEGLIILTMGRRKDSMVVTLANQPRDV